MATKKHHSVLVVRLGGTTVLNLHERKKAEKKEKEKNIRPTSGRPTTQKVGDPRSTGTLAIPSIETSSERIPGSGGWVGRPPEGRKKKERGVTLPPPRGVAAQVRGIKIRCIALQY